MFTIIINAATIDTKSGISKAGKPYRMDLQHATVELPNGERRNIELQHNEGDAPLPVGTYRPKATAGYVDKDRKLIVSTRARSWEPVEPAKAVKAA